MELCIEKGYTKHLGVCNFGGQAIEDLMSYAKSKPICNQIEVHPYLQQPGVVEICQKNGVQVVALDPLCSKATEEEFALSKEEVLIELGNQSDNSGSKYNRTVSQVSLKWLFSKDIGAIIEGSNSSNLQ